MIRVTKLKIKRAMAEGYTLEEAEHGYGFFTSRIFGGKTECIQKLDDLGYFEDDSEAAHYAAESDKVKILGSYTKDGITEYYPDTENNRKVVIPYITAM